MALFKSRKMLLSLYNTREVQRISLLLIMCYVLVLVVCCSLYLIYEHSWMKNDATMNVKHFWDWSTTKLLILQFSFGPRKGEMVLSDWSHLWQMVLLSHFRMDSPSLVLNESCLLAWHLQQINPRFFLEENCSQALWQSRKSQEPGYHRSRSMFCISCFSWECSAKLLEHLVKAKMITRIENPPRLTTIFS